VADKKYIIRNMAAHEAYDGNLEITTLHAWSLMPHHVQTDTCRLLSFTNLAWKVEITYPSAPKSVAKPAG